MTANAAAGQEIPAATGRDRRLEDLWRDAAERAIAYRTAITERRVPPRPEAVLDALMLLMEKIQKGKREPVTVPPREIPELAQLRAKRAVPKGGS